MSLRRRLAAVGLFLLLLVAVIGTWLLVIRPAEDARILAAHRMAPSAPAPAATLTASWLGCTAVLLRAGDDALMIDPFFTRPPGLLPLLRNDYIAPNEARIRSWLQRLGIQRLHAVLVSHSHYDHAMDAGVVARLTGAQLVGSSSTANVGRGAGLHQARLQVPEPGETLQLGPFRVRFIESRHAGATGGKPTGDITEPLTPPARYLDYRQGGTWSILVEHPQASVLHHGSAGYIPGALADVEADMIFLGAALIEDPEAYLQHVVDAANAKRIVLTHWDDFTRSLEEPLKPMPVVVNLEALFDTLQARPDLDVKIPPLNQPFPVTP